MIIKDYIEIIDEYNDRHIITIWLDYEPKPLCDILILNNEGVLQ